MSLRCVQVDTPLARNQRVTLRCMMVLGLSGSGNSSLICQNIVIRPTQGLQKVPRHGGHRCPIIHPTLGVQSHVVVGGPTERTFISKHLHLAERCRQFCFLSAPL